MLSQLLADPTSYSEWLAQISPPQISLHLVQGAQGWSFNTLVPFFTSLIGTLGGLYTGLTIQRRSAESQEEAARKGARIAIEQKLSENRQLAIVRTCELVEELARVNRKLTAQMLTSATTTPLSDLYEPIHLRHSVTLGVRLHAPNCQAQAKAFVKASEDALNDAAWIQGAFISKKPLSDARNRDIASRNGEYALTHEALLSALLTERDAVEQRLRSTAS